MTYREDQPGPDDLSRNAELVRGSEATVPREEREEEPYVVRWMRSNLNWLDHHPSESARAEEPKPSPPPRANLLCKCCGHKQMVHHFSGECMGCPEEYRCMKYEPTFDPTGRVEIKPAEPSERDLNNRTQFHREHGLCACGRVLPGKCPQCDSNPWDEVKRLRADLAQALKDRDVVWASRNELRRELVGAKDDLVGSRRAVEALKAEVQRLNELAAKEKAEHEGVIGEWRAEEAPIIDCSSCNGTGKKPPADGSAASGSKEEPATSDGAGRHSEQEERLAEIEAFLLCGASSTDLPARRAIGKLVAYLREERKGRG